MHAMHVMPVAEVSFVAIPPAVEYTMNLPLEDQYYPVAATPTLTSNNMHLDAPHFRIHSNGYSLQYIGRPAIFHAAFSGTLAVDRASREYAIAVAVNDVLVPASYAQNNWASANTYISSAFHVVLSLNTGDYVNLIAKCLDNANRTMSWRNMNFVCISHEMRERRG